MQAGSKPTARKILETLPNVEMKSKEQQDSDKRVQESLDTLIWQTIGREPFLSLAGTGDSPVQWFHWLDSWDQQNAAKVSRSQKVEAGVDARNSRWADNSGSESTVADADGKKDSVQNGMKGSSVFGRGPRPSGERSHSLKIPEAVVAFAQAAAKANDIPGWPLMPPKLQMLKCGKCSQEFCSQLNYRRHIRVHRRSFNVEKEDLRKERAHVATFWDKLAPEDAGYIVSYKNLMLEDLSGASIVRALANFVQQPGLSFFPQPYLKARAALLDIVQNKASKFPLPSQELFSVLDSSSEKTFLCGVSSVSMQRLIFEGGAGKVGLEARNLVASLGFLVEQRLVKAWVADRDAEALRCQKALVEEEEAAQKKRAKLQERKRLKKIRQKGLKDKERKCIESVSGYQVLDSESLNNVTHAGNVEGGDSSQSSPSLSALSGKDHHLPESSNMDLDDFGGRASGKTDNTFFGLADEEVLHVCDDQLESGWTKVDSEVSAGSVRCKTAATSLLDNTVDGQVGTALVSGQGENQATDVLNHHPPEKVENEKLVMEFKTCNAARFGFDKKSGRGWRERKRFDSNDFLSYQRPPYDRRLYDANYYQKPRTRKPYNVAVNSMQEYSGLSPFSKSSAILQNGQYRDRLSRIRRSATTVGNTHVVWTRKVQNSICENDKEDRTDNVCRHDNPQIHDNTKEFSGENEMVDASIEGICTEDACTSHTVSIFGEVNAGNSGTWPVLPDGSGETLSCDSSVSFDSGSCQSLVNISANVEVEDEANHIDICMPGTVAEAGKQGGSNQECNKGCQAEQISTSGALFIGSLSIPLGDFSCLNSLVRSQETLKRLSRDFQHVPGKKQKGEARTVLCEASQSLTASLEVTKESTSSEYNADSSVCKESRESYGENIDSHYQVTDIKDAGSSDYSGVGSEGRAKLESFSSGGEKLVTIEVWPTVRGVGERTERLASRLISKVRVGPVTSGYEEALPGLFDGGAAKGGSDNMHLKSDEDVTKPCGSSIHRHTDSRFLEMKDIKGHIGKILVEGGSVMGRTSVSQETSGKVSEVDTQTDGDIVKLCNLKFRNEHGVEIHAMNGESTKCVLLPDLVSAFLSQRWADAMASYEGISTIYDGTYSIDEADEHANDPALSSVVGGHVDAKLLVDKNSCLLGITDYCEQDLDGSRL